MSAFRVSRSQLLVLAALVALAVMAVVLAAGLVERERTSTDDVVLPQATPTDGPTLPDDTLGDVEFSVATYEVFLARDPFEPVVPEPAAEGDPDGQPDQGPTDSPTTSPDNGDPGTDPTDPQPTPSEGDSPDGSSCRQNSSVTCDGRTVSLVDVFEGPDGSPRAAVQVDDVIYEVAAGETFATNFHVHSVDGSCVTLLFGDDGFTLCEGESVLK